MKLKEQNTNKTQLDKANAALVDLLVNITAEDRADAPASVATVVAYLKGEGKELDTAIKLLRYFRKRIADREKFLKAS